MINTSESRIIFNGNGTATEFPYSFAIINDTDVKVMTVDPDGMETVLDSDYYVDVTASKVIYPGYPPGEEPAESERPPVLPTGWQLVVYRDIPITQEANLGNVWPFNVIEDALDKITMILQNIYDGFKRSFKVSQSAPADIDIYVPIEANKALKWNADGTQIVTTVDPADVLPQAQNLLQQTTEQANIATNKANAATNKANAAAESAVSAATSETNAANSEDKAQAWAESETSPDGETDADSPTSETMSAKEWALYAKQLAQQIGNPVNNVTEKNGKITIKHVNGDNSSFFVGAVDQSTKKLLTSNYDFSTQEEAEQGNDLEKPLNAQRVKQAIEYNHNKDTVVMYINGGTAENPAEVTINSRYVEQNPFTGYYVSCIVEILVENEWAQPFMAYVSADNGGRGVTAGLVNENIIIQTGLNYLKMAGCDSGSLSTSTQAVKTAPCRVIVSKLGKKG